MTKQLSVPKQLFRSGTTEVNKEKGTIRLSVSSNTPYKRYDYRNEEEYFEVLDHESTGIDSSRLKAGTPLLFNHNRDIIIGRNTAFEIQAGRCYVESQISKAPDVESHRIKIEEGILVDSSVGYQIDPEGECVGQKDGLPIYKFRWSPFEASLVSVPADISVGIRRDHGGKVIKPADSEMQEICVREKIVVDETKPLPHTPNNPQQPSQKKAMPELAEPETKKTPDVDVVKERAGAIAEFKGKCAKIDGFVAALKNPQWKEAAAKIADKHKATDDPNFDEFRTEALNSFEGVRKLDVEEANPKIGMSRKDLSRFSLRKLILESQSRTGLTGIEKEASEAAQKIYHGKDGRQFQGFCIPHDVAEIRSDETFDLDTNAVRALTNEVVRLQALTGRALSASTFASGGFLVGTELLGGSFIDLLRNAALIGQGPFAIIELNGLVGNIAIPKQLTTATVYWLAEGASVTESSFTGGQLLFTPHRMGCQTNWTKQLLLQASLSVEMLVRNDIALAMGIEEDRVTLTGTGLNGEPLGIMNTSGVGADITFGGAAVWGDLVNFEYYIANANVRTGQLVFLTTPLTKSYLKASTKVASSTFPIYLWEDNKGFPVINGVMPGTMNQYPAYDSKQVPSNLVLNGVFNNNVTKARWGGLDVVTEPYTGAASETIKTYVHQWLDVGVRYPQAFEVSVDAPTAP